MFAEGAKRNRALGVFGAMSGLGGAAGFMLGGVLTEWFGWPSVLAVNVPLGAAAIALAPVLLTGAHERLAGRSVDVAGAVSVTAGLVVIAYAIIEANQVGWGSARTVGLTALGVVLLGVFVAVELRARQPLVPLEVFREPMLRMANILAVTLTAAVFPFFFFVTLYLQRVLGFSPFEAGLGQLPVALAMAVAAGALASRLVARYGVRATRTGGLLTAAAGRAWFSRIPASGGAYVVDVLGPAVLVGVGLGLGVVCVTIAGTMTARPDRAGLAAGLINTTQQVGGALGLAALVAVAAAGAGAEPGDAPAGAALVDGFQVAMLVGAAIALGGALLARALPAPTSPAAGPVASPGAGPPLPDGPPAPSREPDGPAPATRPRDERIGRGGDLT
jgi:hypothetical protein